jgi:L-aminopeptidase/D-esterase-like protein
VTSLGFGFRVGHWTDPEARTGCTVVLPPPWNVSSCDVRGSSPGSREIESLHVDNRLREVHAVLLTGGSAYGLGAADGVMLWLAERQIGFMTPAALVPIVPAAVVFDLGEGHAGAWPGPEAGRAACDDAREEGIELGRSGAGTGCTVGKWAGREFAQPGGVGIASVEREGHRVSALAVVNSIGDVLAPDGSVLAGTTSPEPAWWRPAAEEGTPTDTVLALVAVSGVVDKSEVGFLAARGSDGITMSIHPAHTRYDGDIVFAVSAPPDEGAPPPDVDILGVLATEAVAGAVRAAVIP